MKLILILLFFFSISIQAQKPFAVVELFTSEGCSSCPPADEVLNKAAMKAEKNRQPVYFLAYHVDYWNKLGWKDPFSKYQFTLRQENYSRVLPEKEMYTPQAVVNGKYSFTGSEKEKMNEYITLALAATPQILLSALKDSSTNDTLYMSYKVSKENPNYILRWALTENDLTSSVKAGENDGKNLHHNYLVRIFSSTDNPGLIGQSKIPLKGNKLSTKNQLITFIQHKQTMQILAAEKISLQ